MHDGASAHFNLTAQHYLDIGYSNHCIGQGGAQSGPTRSPFDLFESNRK